MVKSLVVKSIMELIYSLIRNPRFYIICLVSILMSCFVTDDKLTMEGMILVPTTIGVIFGGLLTTIAIIFSVIKDEELRELYTRHGDKFTKSLYNLKRHMLLVLICLFITLIVYFFAMPPFVERILISIGMSNMQLFYFTNIFSLNLTMYCTIEVINILFIIFQIKYAIISRKL